MDSDDNPKYYCEYDLSFDIWTAASIGDLDFIRQNLTPDESIDIINKGGWTSLMYASYYDHPEVVSFLVSCGSNVHFGKKTALMLAASCGLVETIRILIHVGEALKNEPTDEKGYTALFHAVTSDHYEACKGWNHSGPERRARVHTERSKL